MSIPYLLQDHVLYVLVGLALLALWLPCLLRKKSRNAQAHTHDFSPWSRFYRRRKNYLTRESIGQHGEFKLWTIMGTTLDQSHYHILNDIYLPVGDSYTQIDFIIISCWGIFVIEAKTMNATICGKEFESCWTAYYGTSRSFQNPLHQNQYHIEALAACTGLDAGLFMHSIVAFSEEARFGTELPDNVMHFEDVPNYILAHSVQTVFSHGEVQKIIEAIREWDASIAPKHRAPHVQHLRQAQMTETPPF